MFRAPHLRARLMCAIIFDLFGPCFNRFTAQNHLLQPAPTALVLVGEAPVTGEVHLVELQINPLDIAPRKVKLNFRVREENIGSVYADHSLGYLFDLLLSLIVISRFALLEFTGEAAKQL